METIISKSLLLLFYYGGYTILITTILLIMYGLLAGFVIEWSYSILIFLIALAMIIVPEFIPEQQIVEKPVNVEIVETQNYIIIEADKNIQTFPKSDNIPVVVDISVIKYYNFKKQLITVAIKMD